jgi:hypothetical protein
MKRMDEAVDEALTHVNARVATMASHFHRSLIKAQGDEEFPDKRFETVRGHLQKALAQLSAYSSVEVVDTPCDVARLGLNQRKDAPAHPAKPRVRPLGIHVEARPHRGFGRLPSRVDQPSSECSLSD